MAEEATALADAEPSIFWLDQPERPAPTEPVVGAIETDLAIVGAGFTGLWAAVLAKEAAPGRDVVLLDAETVGFGASGRNGGFVEASLTHGLANGLAHFPDEIDLLQRLGHENFAAIRTALQRHGVDAGWDESGIVAVADLPHQVDDLRESAAELRRHGEDAAFLDREQVRGELDSPAYLAGVWQCSGAATVDPARLAWGLRTTALALGVRIHEGTPVLDLRDEGAAVRLVTGRGSVRAARAVIGTGAYGDPTRRTRRYVAPVYDYVLVSEPLAPEQRRALGWERRQGFAGSGSRFTYYRLINDERILWGGYDAVYHYGGDVGAHRDRDDRVAQTLVREFRRTFPQLEEVRFTHQWGGAIDTCSRFSVFFGTLHGGKVAYAAGYTGLGVGATRFGAQVALELVDGVDAVTTRLQLVRRRPRAFPPEPLRWPLIHYTQRALAKAEERGGRSGLWLELLDRLGVGFAS